jgi:hypothetical protein
MKKETLRGASQSRSDASSPELEEDVEEEVDLGLAGGVVALSLAPRGNVQCNLPLLRDGSWGMFRSRLGRGG